MVWNNAVARPNDHLVATTGVWRNLFYNDENVVINLAGVSGGYASRYYEVYDLFGNFKTSGSLTAGQTTLNLAPLPLGWYKIYFWRSVSLGNPWNLAGGEGHFCIVRRNTNLITRAPVGTSPAPNDNLFVGLDFPSQGFVGMGPYRHQIRYGANRPADLQASIDNSGFERTWWATDAARPLTQFTQFPDDITLTPTQAILDDITAGVQGLVPTGVVNFECQNEPNASGITAANFITRFNAFADQVHAANVNAKTMGPCTLDVKGQLGWVDTVLASVGNKTDIISFHNYSAGYGLNEIRSVLDGFETVLTKYSLQNKPRFLSEGISRFGATYGVNNPMLQARMTMLEFILYEQYKIPKENVHNFYQTQHGFWSFPSWWMPNDTSERQPSATVALMRVYSEEVFGKAYAAKLDFGTTWNKYFIANRYDHPSNGTKVIAIITDGLDMDVKFQVTGATFLETVDYFGNVSNTAVVSGLLTLPVTFLPKYIRLPAGVTCVPADVNGGRDVYTAQQSRATSSSIKDLTSEAQNAANGDFASTVFRANDSEGTNGTWELAFTNPTRFDRVIVSCPFPWQEDSAMLDFDLQYWNGSSWVTIGTRTENTNTFNWTSGKPANACYVDSYWTRRNIWRFDLSVPITATKIRIFARTCSYGGEGTAECRTGGGQFAVDQTGQGWTRKLCLREVAVYLKRDVGVGVAQGVNAVPGIGITL